MASHLAASVRAALLCLLLGACQRASLEDLPDDNEEAPTDSTGDQVTGGPGGPGSGSQVECDPADADTCPEGQKCTAISDGGPQTRVACVTDDTMLLPGDDCTPAQGTGQDGCSTGHVCLMSQPDDVQGRCTQLCQKNDDCEPGACETSPYTLTTFCAAPCDPLVPDCPPGLSCRQTADRFVCGMNIEETDIGQASDECDLVNLRGCAENLLCMAYALVPGCGYAACCTTVCDLTDGDEQCSSPALCRSPFATPAPGFETIGACFVPQ